MNDPTVQSFLTFIEKRLRDEGGLVRYLTSTEQDRPCWFFLELDPARYQHYKRALRQKSMNVRDFGDILLRGWGERAPENVLRVMKDKYEVICG